MLKFDRSTALFYGWLTVVFVFAPLTHFRSLLDFEFAPRFLLLSTSILVGSVFLLFRKKANELKDWLLVRPVVLFFLASVVWMFIRLFSSVNPGDALSEWLRWTVLFCLFTYGLLLFPADKEKAAWTIAIFATIASISFIGFGCWQYIQLYLQLKPGDHIRIDQTFASTLSNKNFFAETLVVLIPFQVYIFIRGRNGFKLLIALLLVLTAAMIFMIMSAAAFLGLFAGIIFFLFGYLNWVPRKESSSRIKFGFVIGLVIIIGLFFFSGGYKSVSERFNRFVYYSKHPDADVTKKENNNSVFERLMIWRNSVRMIKANPLFGSGLNNWKILYPKYGSIEGTVMIDSGRITYEHPHNDYLLVFAEQGLVGFLLYLAFYFYLFKIGIRRIKQCNNATSEWFVLFLLSGTISYLVISCFAYPRSRMFEPMLMMIVYSCIVSISSEESGIVRRIFKGWFVLPLILALLAVQAAYARINGEANIRTVLVEQKRGNYPYMLRSAEKAQSWYFPIDLTATPIHWYEGMANFYLGKKEVALENYSLAEKNNPFHVRLLNDYGTCAEQNGDRIKAIELYKRALSISPRFLEGLLNISATYYNFGKPDSAFYYIDRAYGLPMEYEYKMNYKRYLAAILPPLLNQKIANQSQPFDKNCLNKWISTPDSLVSFYLYAKDTNMEFIPFLLKKCSQ